MGLPAAVAALRRCPARKSPSPHWMCPPRPPSRRGSSFRGVTQTGDQYVPRNTDAPDALQYALLNAPRGATVSGGVWWDCYRDLVTNVVLIDAKTGFTSGSVEHLKVAQAPTSNDIANWPSSRRARFRWHARRQRRPGEHRRVHRRPPVGRTVRRIPRRCGPRGARRLRRRPNYGLLHADSRGPDDDADVQRAVAAARASSCRRCTCCPTTTAPVSRRVDASRFRPRRTLGPRACGSA